MWAHGGDFREALQRGDDLMAEQLRAQMRSAMAMAYTVNSRHGDAPIMEHVCDDCDHARQQGQAYNHALDATSTTTTTTTGVRLVQRDAAVPASYATSRWGDPRPAIPLLATVAIRTHTGELQRFILTEQNSRVETSAEATAYVEYTSSASSSSGHPPPVSGNQP